MIAAALTDVGHYVAAGWVITAVSIGAYASWLLRRGRRLSRQVPAEERRWSDS